MPEKITAENLLNNIMESLSDNIPMQKSGSFEKDVSEQVTSQFNRLFGRQRPLHHVLGGGKSADVLLWRNRKISAGVLASATAIWVLFEWLNYHLFPLMCFALVLGMLVQFIWSIASRATDRPQVPRLDLSGKFFVNIATLGGAEINKALGFLQDVACSGNTKQFLVVVASLCTAAVIGSWCNFLTLLYIGFVTAHTFPVLYEKYEDQVDNFANNLLRRMRQLGTGKRELREKKRK